jgi:hypothetical protein
MELTQRLENNSIKERHLATAQHSTAALSVSLLFSLASGKQEKVELGHFTAGLPINSAYIPACFTQH